jgi:prepilin-type N-terminal cleavage/methylation domain-containing protein/prepilin-type processing-associated H-X9-DG protein
LETQPGGMMADLAGNVWLTDANRGKLLHYAKDGSLADTRDLGLKSPSGLIQPDPKLPEILVASLDEPVTARSLTGAKQVHYVDATTPLATLRGSERMGMAWDAQNRLIVMQDGPNPRVYSIRGDYIQDADGDKLSDGMERFVYKTDPLKADTDGDGLSDYQELWSMKPTDPLKADSDGDGVKDGAEIHGRPPTDPKNPNDPLPPLTNLFIGLAAGIFLTLTFLGASMVREQFFASPFLSGVCAILFGVGAALALGGGLMHRLPQAWVLRTVFGAFLASGIGLAGVDFLMKRAKPRKPSGFTLIELLVVIAVIAILAAILFPAFARAREKSYQATCESNERQIGLAVAQYVQDWDGALPNIAHDVTDNPYSWTQTLSQFLRTNDVMWCPSDIHYKQTDIRKSSYVINSLLSLGTLLTEIPGPSEVIYAGEAGPLMVGDHYHPTNGVAAMHFELNGHQHGDGSNYLFLDGHVKWMRFDDTLSPKNLHLVAQTGNPNPGV